MLLTVFPKLSKRLHEYLHETWALSGLFPLDKLAARKKRLNYIPGSINGDVAIAATQQVVKEVIICKMSTTTQEIVKGSVSEKKNAD